MDSNSSAGPDVPMEAVGFSLRPLTWTIGLLLLQIAFMVIRFDDWWRATDPRSKMEFGLVLLMLGLACVSLWRVRSAFKTWMNGDSENGGPSRTQLVRAIGPHLSVFAAFMYLMTLMFSILLARVIDSP